MDDTRTQQVFRTSDGWTLLLVKAEGDPHWTDGEMTFDDDNGWPVDNTGKRLDGALQSDLLRQVMILHKTSPGLWIQTDREVTRILNTDAANANPQGPGWRRTHTLARHLGGLV